MEKSSLERRRCRTGPTRRTAGRKFPTQGLAETPRDCLGGRTRHPLRPPPDSQVPKKLLSFADCSVAGPMSIRFDGNRPPESRATLPPAKTSGNRACAEIRPVRRLLGPSFSSCDRLGRLCPTLRREDHRCLSPSSRRYLLVSCGRFRRFRLEGGCLGLHRILQGNRGPGRLGSVAIGKRSPCVDLLLRTRSGTGGPKVGRAPDQPHLRPHPATFPFKLRPPLSKPRHPAQWRVWQPERPPSPETSPGEGKLFPDNVRSPYFEGWGSKTPLQENRSNGLFQDPF